MTARTTVLVGTLAALGCGYHAVYGGEGAERFHVVVVRSIVPDAIASDEVASALRATLSREGALLPGDGYPRVEVTVLREDEVSEGVAAPSTTLGGSVTTTGALGPRARATEVGVVARACVVREKGGACERDTGDIRAMDLGASDVALGTADVVADAFHHRDLTRDAARRVGERLARQVMGEPAASDESVGRER